MIKRSFDTVCAAVSLVLLAPVMALIAFWIKLDSSGPAFFRQERVGRLGRIFRIHKFRTMASDTVAGGLTITVAQDPRVTRAGELLRRYKLDELPQLIDVLNGDMSLVGPRPEVPEFVSLYPAEAREEILSVRPGITDETSLRFRNESELLAGAIDPRKFYVERIMPMKITSYIEYVRTRTFCGDCRILARTVRYILID
jgi:lipopolysaccharide/colanic/teichoic acid biosynthesis glycosyltransferase